jgi:hypothetical protein
MRRLKRILGYWGIYYSPPTSKKACIGLK